MRNCSTPKRSKKQITDPRIASITIVKKYQVQGLASMLNEPMSRAAIKLKKCVNAELRACLLVSINQIVQVLRLKSKYRLTSYILPIREEKDRIAKIICTNQPNSPMSSHLTGSLIRCTAILSNIENLSVLSHLYVVT